jgi:hypothetical protein
MKFLVTRITTTTREETWVVDAQEASVAEMRARHGEAGEPDMNGENERVEYHVDISPWDGD